MSQPATVLQPAEAAPPPRWIAPWLALLAPLYVISPLALLALPQLKKLPITAKWILVFYAVSQQVPALFAPEPLLASVLALARTLLMFGLMGVGVALRSSEGLKPFAIGLGVVFVTALVYSVSGGADVLTSRLNHPYMTPITLGLGGAFGVWTALFTRGNVLWRIPLGLSGLLVLLLSGSRGPLIAALVGSLLGFFINRRPKSAIILSSGIILLVSGLYLGDKLNLESVSRLISADTTGRDVVWYNTLDVIRSERWSGVGVYRLGKYLEPSNNSCILFLKSDGTTTNCPRWIKNLGSPWLIAHNATIQELAESGPFGLMGLFLLLGAIVMAFWNGNSSSEVAIVSGLIISTINDNTLLVPSPFFAEIFWIVCGMQLLKLQEPDFAKSLISSGVVIIISIPVFFVFVMPRKDLPVKISFINAQKYVRTPKEYQVIVKYKLPPGNYRTSLNSCDKYCVTLYTIPFTSKLNSDPVLILVGDLLDVKYQRLELRLLKGNSSFNLHPLGIMTWKVMVKQ